MNKFILRANSQLENRVDPESFDRRGPESRDDYVFNTGRSNKTALPAEARGYHVPHNTLGSMPQF